MRIYDISLTISPNLPVWPGDTPIWIERVEKIEEGAPSNITRIEMSVHCGTHVDAPYHFLGDHGNTVEHLPIEVLNGRAYVIQISDDVDLITKDVLIKASCPPRVRRLLIKTRNSDFWRREDAVFQENFVGLSADGAQYLVDRGITLVGIDYLSIAPFEEVKSTHQILLNADIVILEGLNLFGVSQGRYTLHCLPLKISGSDGAPARAILVGF